MLGSPDSTWRRRQLKAIQMVCSRDPFAGNTVAFVERFIQTLQHGCLDYFVVFGEKHIHHLVSEMVTPLSRGAAAQGEGE